jgi:hypothetical protein
MVENISSYLYVHHVCFKCTTFVCKKTNGIHEIKDFVWVFNEPIKLGKFVMYATNPYPKRIWVEHICT